MAHPEAPRELPAWLKAALATGLDPCTIAAMAPHADDRSLAEALAKERRVIFGGEETDSLEKEPE